MAMAGNPGTMASGVIAVRAIIEYYHEGPAGFLQSLKKDAES